MQTTSGESRAALLDRIRTDLATAERRIRELRRANSGLLAAVLVTTAAATLLAGVAAGTGPPLGDGTVAWRWTCGIIAVLTSLSGLFTGAQQKFGIADRLARLLACSGRLRALELALALARRDPTDLVRDYEEIVALYPELYA